MRITPFLMISSTLAILSSATPVPWPHPGSDNDDNYGLNHVYPDPTTIVVAPSVPTVNNDVQRTAQRRPPRRPLISTTTTKRKSMEDTETAASSNNKNDLDLSNGDPTASAHIVDNQLRKKPREGRRQIQFTKDDDAAIEEWLNSMDRTRREVHQRGVKRSRKEAKEKGQDPDEAARRYIRKAWTTFMSKHRERESEGRRKQYTEDDEAAMKNWKESMSKSRQKKHQDGRRKVWEKAVAEGKDPEQAVERYTRKGWTSFLSKQSEAGGRTKQDTEDNEAAIVEWEERMSNAQRKLRQIASERVKEKEAAAGRDPRDALERHRTNAWKKAMANARRKESSAGGKKATEKTKKDGDDVEEAMTGSESHEDSSEGEKRKGTTANAVTNLDHLGSAPTITPPSPPPPTPPVARKSKYSHLNPEDSGKISLDFE